MKAVVGLLFVVMAGALVVGLWYVWVLQQGNSKYACDKFTKDGQKAKCGIYTVSDVINNQYRVYSVVGLASDLQTDEQGFYRVKFKTNIAKLDRELSVILGSPSDSIQVLWEKVPNGDVENSKGELIRYNLEEVKRMFKDESQVMLKFIVYENESAKQEVITKAGGKKIQPLLLGLLNNNQFVLKEERPDVKDLYSLNIVTID